MAEALISTSDILLPGGTKQFEHLIELTSLKGNHALIIGNGCESITKEFLSHFQTVNIITDNYDSLIQFRMNLKNDDRVRVKMMDYTHTDFKDKHFDLIYAQGSISVPNKKEIVKELKRILAIDGVLCVGEIVSLKEPVPAFVNDIWDRSGLEPIASSELKKYYEAKGFEVINEKDLSHTLKYFYGKTKHTLLKVSKDDREADKKYFSRIKYEANAYLKLGGDKYIGFKSLILRKLN